MNDFPSFFSFNKKKSQLLQDGVFSKLENDQILLLFDKDDVLEVVVGFTLRIPVFMSCFAI